VSASLVCALKVIEVGSDLVLPELWDEYPSASPKAAISFQVLWWGRPRMANHLSV